MQMRKRPGREGGGAPPWLPQDAWVLKVALRVPNLALAADRALLAFVQRAAARFGPAGATSTGSPSGPVVSAPAQGPIVPHLIQAEATGAVNALPAADERAAAGVEGAEQQMPPGPAAGGLEGAEQRALPGPAAASPAGPSSRPDLEGLVCKRIREKLQGKEGAVSLLRRALVQPVLLGLGRAVDRMLASAERHAVLAEDAPAGAAETQAAGLQLWIEELSLEPLQLLVDAHFGGMGSTLVPYPVDITRRASFRDCAVTESLHSFKEPQAAADSHCFPLGGGVHAWEPRTCLRAETVTVAVGAACQPSSQSDHSAQKRCTAGVLRGLVPAGLLMVPSISSSGDAVHAQAAGDDWQAARAAPAVQPGPGAGRGGCACSGRGTAGRAAHAGQPRPAVEPSRAAAPARRGAARLLDSRAAGRRAHAGKSPAS